MVLDQGKLGEQKGRGVLGEAVQEWRGQVGLMCRTDREG